MLLLYPLELLLSITKAKKTPQVHFYNNYTKYGISIKGKSKVKLNPSKMAQSEIARNRPCQDENQDGRVQCVYRRSETKVNKYV